MATLTTFNPGDVLRYTPLVHHWREGMARVREDGRILDTYWRPGGDSESHALTEQELASATVVFNVAEFDALDRYSASSREQWEAYHPDDRALISSQHGLQEALFVRKGAHTHLGTQIENARTAVAKAEAELGTAIHTFVSRREHLSALEGRER